MGKFLKPTAAVTLNGTSTPDAGYNLATFNKQDLINHLNGMTENQVAVFFYQNTEGGPVQLGIAGLTGGVQAGNPLLGPNLPCPDYCPSR